MRHFFTSLHPAAKPSKAASPGSGGRSRGEDGGGRAAGRLALFMRCLAGIWVIQGLMQWSAILVPAEPLFDKVTAAYGAAVVFFALLDPVAAVGLWLVTPWGGVIWFFSAIAQIFIAFALPGSVSLLWVGADTVLITVYFVLAWRASGAGLPRFIARHR